MFSIIMTFTLEIIFMIAVLLVPYFGWWRIFLKSGHPGWKCLIPIYNIIIFLKIIKRSEYRVFYYILYAPLFLPFLILLIEDSWRLMTVFGQNSWSYELFGNKGWIAVLIFSPVIIGQNVAHIYLGFPFIAFNKHAVYDSERYLNSN